jgi:hypothetical protein
MALNDLSLTEMVAATEAWVGAERSTFLSIPEIAGLFSLVEQAHASVVEVAATQEDPVLAGVSELVSRVDDRHDHALRALFFSALAASEYLLSLDPPGHKEAAKILAARDALLEEGLAGTMFGFGEEAGRAERAMLTLSANPEYGKTLEKVRIFGEVTARDAAECLGSLGAELGALEQKRTALESRSAGMEQPSARKARALWMKTVATVLGALDLARVTKPTASLIAGPITRASERAAARRASTPTVPPSSSSSS